ncbi:MAG: ribosome small subunit-dependent GTPase A [Oscillospiraceae bacterium]|nr:ribosome small subunit-dependent GTPase A [Oscillospiraceae bacterium]
MEKGRIIKSSGGFYYVDNGSEIIECRARGKFRKDKISPCVGDFVDVELTADSKGYVVAIDERKNVLSRPSVANIDRLLLIAAAADPAPNRFVIDKILTIAEYQDIDTVLIVTKTDVADADSLITDYRKAGYTVMGVNSLEDDVSEIRELIKGRLCVLAGNTGVGKSTLLNALAPSLEVATGETSKKLGRGRHTTRTTEMFPVCGGFVADTPGFSAIDLEMVEPIKKDKLELCFPEFEPYLLKCKFTGCSHTCEKGCAVLEALDKGEISQSRHKSYCALYEEAKKRPDWET